MFNPSPLKRGRGGGSELCFLYFLYTNVTAGSDVGNPLNMLSVIIVLLS